MPVTSKPLLAVHLWIVAKLLNSSISNILNKFDFYAFLSLIIGQSYFLKIIIDTNKKFREKKIQFKRKKITHDQNILTWFFLSWFLRFATMYGFLNMVGFGQKVNYAPAFYENINFYCCACL